jgi:signal transduction histidine kinase
LPFLVGELGIIVLVLLALLVALAVNAWIRLVWRDLSRFDRTANAFGGGDFEARLSVWRSSGLSRLAESFNGMAARIQGLMRSRKVLTNAGSHELRTPIARPRFGIDMLADSTDETSRRRFLGGMKADVDDLDALVSELLTFARFNREAPKLEFQRQDVSE